MKSLRELMDLSGRVTLITGGAGHVGKAMGGALAELGSAIAVLDLDEAAAEATAAEFRKTYRVRAIALTVDLAREADVRLVPGHVVEKLGRLDVLINNAALVGTSTLTGWAVPFAQQRSEAWRAALEVNLTAPFVLAQAAAPALADSTHGSIINVGSIYGLVGPDSGLYEGTAMGNPAAYAASKAGLLQLTRWLSTVLAPGIRVNSITLGGIERGQSDIFQTRYVARTPMKRMGAEQDVKGAAAYLASDLSAYVTGQNIVIDGGWTAW